MPATADFNIWYGLIGLLPLIIYIVLIFIYKDPLPITFFCVLIGAVITNQSVLSFSNALGKAMGSFLALVGLIIMLGRGLGEILIETKVSHTIVHKIIHGIGVNTENKAIVGIMISCLIIIGLLGTMAGGNAIIAPIVLPVAAATGLTRSTVSVLFQACGEEGLILGPFTPPVITLMGLTHISYGDMLIKCCLPVSCVTLLTTWVMVHRIQKSTKGVNDFDTREKAEEFVPNKETKRISLIFIIAFIIAVAYGIIVQAGTNYVITVMLGLSLLVGFAAKIKPGRIFKLIVKGMSANLHLFMLFLFLELFMNFMEQAGAFKAVTLLLQPLVNWGGRVAVPIIGGLTGAVGITGATVAVMKMVNDMFGGLVTQYGITMTVWTTVLIVATRATNFVHPGSNMFSSMGFAGSDDLISMIKNGWTVAAMQILFLVVYSILLV